MNGYPITHFDHPGTPVQVIGAVVIKVYHYISNPNADLAADVLSRPEAYLYVINKILVILNCIATLLLGIFTYKISKNIYAAILIQLSPFTSTEIFYGLIIVTAENFLIFACLCFIAILIYYLYKINIDKKPSFVFVIFFAVVCGLGLATKLSFLPLLLVPLLIIKSLKQKLIFLLFTVISFLIFVFPAISNYEAFVTWVERLFINSGQYGSGESTIIDSSTFFKNILKIFITDNLFGLSYIIALLTLVYYRLQKSRMVPVKSDMVEKQYKLLLAIFLAFTLQIILVAKHYAQYYMVPSFILCVLVFILSTSIFCELLKKYKTKLSLNYIFMFMSILILFWSGSQIVLSYYEGNNQRNEAVKIGKYITDNYPGMLIISTFGSAGQDCALAFTSQYAGSQYSRYRSLLSQKLSSHIFYNPWLKQFYSIPDQNIKEEILKRKKFILQINHWASVAGFLNELKKMGIEEPEYKEVFENGNKEKVYEINVKK